MFPNIQTHSYGFFSVELLNLKAKNFGVVIACHLTVSGFVAVRRSRIMNGSGPGSSSTIDVIDTAI
ncbi:hypothetical protein VKT23_015992 [Stygiomarasmius scandens]|uniref:Uncharacterized protein n=1 Tax=Marasmiellus scandens TaxID=2682957 RepID=A0ABR1IW11_9AGAR